MASEQYRAGEWAMMGRVGYTRPEDEGLWAGMVGGDWEEEEEVKEVKEENPHHHHHGQSTTHQTTGHQN